jgi:hypothetical protein
MAYRKKDSAMNCLRHGTLAQLFEESQKKDNQRVLNALDIPLGFEQRNIGPFRYSGYS